MNKVKTKEKNTTSKKERDLINLTIRKKKATTEEEKKLAAEIENLKKKGRIVSIPHD